MKKNIYIALFQIDKNEQRNGLREILYTIKKNYSQRYNVKISNKIVPNKRNILIENFNKRDVIYIKSFKKKYPNTKFFCVITEWLGKTSFNTDENYFNILKYYFLEFVLLNLFKKLPFNPKRAFFFWQRKIYFHKIVSEFESLISIHNKINENYSVFRKKIYTFYPIINLKNCKISKIKKFVICGQITKNRVFFYKEILNSVSDPTIQKTNFYNYNFHEFKFNFKNNGLFAVDIPKTSLWKFSSCTRYLSSILMGRIPIINKKFNDHAAEDICYVLKKVNKKNILYLINNCENIYQNCVIKTIKYLKLANANNNITIKQFYKKDTSEKNKS